MLLATRPLSILVLLLAAPAASCKNAKSAPAPPPAVVKPVVAELPAGEGEPLGVIFITVDTMRADYLGCYGNPRVLTPNFDRLASGAVLFRQAISQATTTTPSHASMMTSLYLQDHNVYSNFEALGLAPRTLAEVLSGRGYATFALVNMSHLNPEVSGLGQGFQTFVKSGFMRKAGPSVDSLLGWLDKLGEQRFFAWVHASDVHTPYSPPPPYDHFYYDDDERDPAKHSLARIWHLLPNDMATHPLFLSWLEGITDVDWVVAQYQGAVTYVDDEVGRLIDGLEARGLLGRTAIVLTADHGESLGEHEMYFVHTGLYEPTIHVPLITYFPGAGRQGVHVRDVVEGIDIMPTILAYLGVPAPHGIRGRSLWPLIRGEVQPQRLAMTEHAGRNLVALRGEQYKYIKHLRTLYIQPSYPFTEGREELYDLKADPRERRDLSRELPDVIRVFRRELAARRAERQSQETGVAELNQEAIETLRALGYVR